MAYPLRYATASQEVPLGYFVDSTDGNTEETGLTIANTDIKLHKTGATTLANKNSGGATHISNGVYYAVLDDTDTNTLGGMVIFVHVAGALCVRLECEVLAQAIYDARYGSGNLPANMKAISDDTTAADNLEAACDGTTYNIGGGAVVAASVTTKTGYELTAAYDAAKTAAQAGNQMDLVDAPNATALQAIADVMKARQMSAESYAADGAVPTLSQFLWMIWSAIADYGISGTTLTARKQDGTAAMTFTLDDATTPTSRTRAT